MDRCGGEVGGGEEWGALSGMSRNVLSIQIEIQRVEREGLAVTNFEQLLPKPQSDLARESLKDPYRLDFLGLSKDAEERSIDRAECTPRH